MKAALGLWLALAIATPAAARVEELKPRTTGLPSSAIVAGQTSATALDEGRMLLAGDNPAQAISAFNIALAQSPQSVAALNGLAVAYDRLGRSDLARQHFEMALALEPDAGDIAYNLGLSFVHAGQDRAAIAPLQRAAMGKDARAAAAARRTLAQVAARLTTPAAPAAVPVLADAGNAGSRIDMASSGEAVLVLAPARPATPAGSQPAPARLAAVEPALAARLGDAAALTIPLALAAPVAAEAPAPAAPLQGPQPQPRRIASRAPKAEMPVSVPVRRPSPPAPILPLQTANLPAVTRAAPPRQPAIATVSVHWRGDAVAGLRLVNRRRETAQRPHLAAYLAAYLPGPLPAPLPNDNKAAIRLAIARLESLLILIRGQHG